jgi:hypothetical protein
MRELLSRRQMLRQYPGSLTLYERHVWSVSALLLLITVAAAIGVIWAINGYSWK